MCKRMDEDGRTISFSPRCQRQSKSGVSPPGVHASPPDGVTVKSRCVSAWQPRDRIGLRDEAVLRKSQQESGVAGFGSWPRNARHGELERGCVDRKKQAEGEICPRNRESGVAGPGAGTGTGTGTTQLDAPSASSSGMKKRRLEMAASSRWHLHYRLLAPKGPSLEKVSVGETASRIRGGKVLEVLHRPGRRGDAAVINRQSRLRAPGQG